jgi:hypothetical protein
MPFWIVPLMVLLNTPMTDGWSLTRRASVLSKRDLAIVAGGVTMAGILPYAEELRRCVREARWSQLAGDRPKESPQSTSRVTRESA